MKRLAFALSLGAEYGILLAGGTAQPDKLKDITCEQYLAMDEDGRMLSGRFVTGAAEPRQRMVQLPACPTACRP